MKIRPYFKWFDFWVGWFWDRKNRALYLGYFPMLGIKLQFKKRPTAHSSQWIKHDLPGGVGIAGIVKKSHVREDGVTVLDDIELDSVSLIDEDKVVDPHAKILRIDRGRDD